VTTYREYLEQHSYLVEREMNWEKVYAADKARYDSVSREYNDAAPTDRAEIEPRFASAYESLQRSEKGLSAANNERVQYEFQHHQFDAAQRAGVEPPPTDQEKRENTGQNVINTFAAAGLATQLHAATLPNLDPTVRVENISYEQQLKNEEQQGETFAQKHADEIREQLDDKMEEFAKDPLELKAQGEEREAEAKTFNETIDKAVEDAPKRGAEDITPPRDPFESRRSDSDPSKSSSKIPDPDKRSESLGRSDATHDAANDNVPPRSAANDNIPQPTDNTPLPRSSNPSPSLPNPDPPTQQIAAGPTPANDNQQRAANDNDRR
jgi:hypothetical protein